MNQYLQETDTYSIDMLSYLFPERPPNETVGGTRMSDYLPVTTNQTVLTAAWKLVLQVADPRVGGELRRLVSHLDNVITTFHHFKFDLDYIPQLHAHEVEDGSALLEWTLPHFRVGFSIDLEPSDSSWFLVTDASLGQISASGYLSGVEWDSLIPWLLSFVLANS